ncbi:MAG TPA: YbhB/YbcL family Raf kinase inhibitor-like protein [Gemmataceae bacterium]|nr:YbhB/YbcL family Raf kinase inhibitor-like protein [Gemmataceae bacterium]
MSFELTSTAFEEGRPIPERYSGEGENLSPPLKWTDPPKGTQALALMCEDPDAPRGTFTHWIVFNMPAVSRELSEGTPTEGVLPNGTVQGQNDARKVGYMGPKPPPGKAHRYFFKLFALDRPLHLKCHVGRGEFLEAIERHVLAEAQLMGTYQHGQGQAFSHDPIEKKAQQGRASIYTAPLSEP